MKAKLLTFIFLVNLMNSYSQGFLDKIVHVWGTLVNGTSHLAVEQSGCFYLTGSFEDTIFLGEQGEWLTPIDSSDSFILKFDAAGDLVWTRLLTGAGSEFIFDLEVDLEGYLYLIVDFDQTIILDTAFIDIGSESDDFLCKLDPDGKLVKLRLGSENNEYVRFVSLELNTAGDVCVIGIYKGDHLFSYDVGNNGKEYNGFISLMDKDFNVQWIIPEIPVSAVMPDKQDNILISGVTDSSLVFPDTIIESVSSLYIGKLDPDGNLVWIETIGMQNYAEVEKVFVDRYNNVYMFGEGDGPYFFPDTIEPSPYWYGYIAKFNEDGEYLWCKGLDMRFYTYVVDYDGYTYGAYFFRNTNYENGFIAIDPDGNTVLDEMLEDITITELNMDGMGNIFYNGWFVGDISINDEVVKPGEGDNYLVGQLKTEEIKGGLYPERIKQVSHLYLHPNPSDGIIYMDLQADELLTQIVIFDFTGRLIYTGIPGENVIDMSGLKSGIYMFRIQTNKRMITEKIMIY